MKALRKMKTRHVCIVRISIQHQMRVGYHALNAKSGHTTHVQVLTKTMTQHSYVNFAIHKQSITKFLENKHYFIFENNEFFFFFFFVLNWS